MAATVFILPIGHVEADALDDLAWRIGRRCALTCRLCPGMDHPAAAFDKIRHQYDARLILNQMQAHFACNGDKHLGITPVDLFVPILTFVFGLSRLNGHCALVSLHRLRPPIDEAVLRAGRVMERLEKTAVHELGHTYGLTHCADRRCVMYAATRIDDTDAKSADFCPLCRDVFRWRATAPIDPCRSQGF